MAPPGRRRGRVFTNPQSIICTILAALYLFLQPVIAAQAVLGIDLGTEYIKAALVKPGIPLEIVLTKDSKRKESSAVAFKSSSSNEQFPERFYGGDALALAPRFPGDVYPNLKQLLGAIAPFDEAVTATFRERYPALELIRNEKFGRLSFQSQGIKKENGLYTVEELLAMELQAVKANAEALAGNSYTIRDVVITVPSFYTSEERSAIGLAADLADLRIIGLVSDGLAVGLNYATSRKFDDKPEINLVYDMGAGSTTATLLKFEAKKVKDVGRFNKTVQEVSVIGSGWDRSLGGDSLNDVIVKDMVEKFVQSNAAKKADIQTATIKSHGRTMAKLRREAERMRQVLSANTETSGNFESLYEDIDFKYKITRTEFEALASEYIERVGNPIVAALLMADIPMDKVDAIIVHGGASRTPFVQGVLERIAGSAARLKSNVNADEAAVFGAAFKAAGLSPSFKVKEIRAKDSASYGAICEWTVNGKTRTQNIFVPTSLTGTVKEVPFKNQEDFTLSLSQVMTSIGNGNPIKKPLAMYSFDNLTASIAELVQAYGCSKENITTTVSMRLDPIAGVPEVSGGSVSCEAQDISKKGGVVEGMKDLFGFGSKDEQKPLEDGGDESSSTEPIIEIDLGSDSNNETDQSGKSSKKSKSKNKTTVKSKKNKIQVINLRVGTKFEDAFQPSQSDLSEMKSRLTDYDRADTGRRLREELFNTLESYTYRARDYLTDTGFISSSTEEQRNDIAKQLQSTSEWLYTDGVQATYDVVKDKLQELRSLVDPVHRRKSEATIRPLSLKLLQDTLASTELFASEIAEEVEKAVALVSAAAASSLESALTKTEIPLDASPLPDTSSDTDDSESESENDTLPQVTETPLQLSDITAYTNTDILDLSEMYEDIKDWLKENLEKQDKLTESDDPVLLSADMDKYTAQLKKLVSELQRRTIRIAPKSRSSKTAKSTKVKSTATETISASESVTQPVDPTVAAQEDHYRGQTTRIEDDSAMPSGHTILMHEEL